MSPRERISPPGRALTAFAMVIGAGELATGAHLLASPATVEAGLGLAPSPAAATIFLRWIGVFVSAVGLAYLAPWLASRADERALRLRFALETTAAVRLFVAFFVVSAVAAGGLAAGWIGVGAYDGLLGIGQILLLARGAFGRVG